MEDFEFGGAVAQTTEEDAHVLVWEREWEHEPEGCTCCCCTGECQDYQNEAPDLFAGFAEGDLGDWS